MKRSHFNKAVLTTALGLGLGFMVAGTSAVAQTEFRGGGFITDFNAACAEDWPSGSTVQVTARLRPAGETGNPANSNVLNVFLGNYTMHFRFGELPENQWRPIDYFASIGGGFGVQPDVMPRIRRLPSPPGTVLSFESDNAIHAIAEINNFSWLPNCRVRLNLWLHRQ